MQKKTAIILVFCMLAALAQPVFAGECAFKGIPLHGKVKVVSSFPDIRVEVVNSQARLRVKKVEHFPDSCGEWQFVDNFPDFTIQYVESFPDITIQMVDSFPGE